MLNILIKAETPDDKITPINVASALIEIKRFDVNDLNEIAEHLQAYTNRVRQAGIDI